MKNGKNIIIILAIIFSIIILALILIRVMWENIHFKFSFKGVDLSQFNLAQLAQLGLGGQTSATLRLALNIKNDNNISIPFRNVKAWLYYENVLVAETSPKLQNGRYKVLANSDRILDLNNNNQILPELTDDVHILVNSSSIKLITEKIAGNKPRVDYVVKGIIGFKSFSHPDYFIWNGVDEQQQ